MTKFNLDLMSLEEGRAIYISYNKPDDPNMPNKWLRRCDHVVQDRISGKVTLVTCFVLRVPDTNFAVDSRNRKITDPFLFEDHIIGSDGGYQVRKYRYIDGQLDLLEPENLANGEYRKVRWQAVTFYPQQKQD